MLRSRSAPKGRKLALVTGPFVPRNSSLACRESWIYLEWLDVTLEGSVDDAENWRVEVLEEESAWWQKVIQTFLKVRIPFCKCLGEDRVGSW